MTSPSLEFRLTNYPKAKRALSSISSPRTYRGAMRDTITAMLDIAQNYAMRITHIYTGTLKMSHVTEYDGHRMVGRLFVDPHVLARSYGGRLKSPQQFVAEYAIYEHQRGGSHAFYERTVNETGGVLNFEGFKVFKGYMDKELP